MNLHREKIRLFKYEQALKLEDDTKSDVCLEEEDQKHDLLCRQCLKKITSLKARTLIKGQHKHVFFNPHGLVFEIGCFSSARGFVLLGTGTREFSWFEGYSWQIVICADCHLHLGWRYLAADSGFYGFILKNLVTNTLKDN